MDFKKLAVFIAIPLIAGIIIGLIINPYMDYGSLNKPFLSPPSFVFPLAWSILYILMGISAYIISKDGNVPIIYYIQLCVNMMWSIVFFVFKLRLFAFVWIILLIILVIMMIRKFFGVNSLAAYLQIPYLIWLLFAAYLNLGVYFLN